MILKISYSLWYSCIHHTHNRFGNVHFFDIGTLNIKLKNYICFSFVLINNKKKINKSINDLKKDNMHYVFHNTEMLHTYYIYVQTKRCKLYLVIGNFVVNVFCISIQYYDVWRKTKTQIRQSRPTSKNKPSYSGVVMKRYTRDNNFIMIVKS